MRNPPIDGPAGDVVDHQDAAKLDGGLVDVHDLGRTQLVGEGKATFHGHPLLAVDSEMHGLQLKHSSG
jgi:hypothetical protein